VRAGIPARDHRRIDYLAGPRMDSEVVIHLRLNPERMKVIEAHAEVAMENELMTDEELEQFLVEELCKSVEIEP